LLIKPSRGQVKELAREHATEAIEMVGEWIGAMLGSEGF
jgi:hypothetical protein